MTISTFDRENLPLVRADIDAALKAVTEKHGITLRLGNITFDPSGASFTASLQGRAGDFAAVAAREAVSWASQFGVDASKPSTLPNRQGATLVQFDMKKRSKPWVFAWQGQQYVTDDAGLRLMWPAVQTRGPTAVEANDLIR